MVTIGFSLDQDRSPTEGILGAVAGGVADNYLWRITNTVNHGESGSPVFDASGQVVGLVKGGYGGAQGMNFMVPLNFADTLLINALGIQKFISMQSGSDANSSSNSAELPLEQNVPVMPWPFTTITAADLRIRDIDDFMWITVNDNSVIDNAAYGQIVPWTSFKQFLRPGANEIRVVIRNGNYGGCGGVLETRINGSIPIVLQRAWSIPIERATVNGLCVDETIKFILK